MDNDPEREKKPLQKNPKKNPDTPASNYSMPPTLLQCQKVASNECFELCNRPQWNLNGRLPPSGWTDLGAAGLTRTEGPNLLETALEPMTCLEEAACRSFAFNYSVWLSSLAPWLSL